MDQYLRPGVYIQELPGPQLISAVTTSNTAFVGLTELGQPNQATLITSWNQYVSTFGGFMWSCQLPFAVYSFFIQGGALCYVVPVAAPGMAKAQHVSEPLTITAAGPGSWGDSLYVSIANFPPSGPATPDAPDGPLAPVTPVFAIYVRYKMPPAGQPLSLSDQLVQSYALANKVQAAVADGETYYTVESYPGFTIADLQKTATQPSNLETRINSQSLFIRVTVDAANMSTRPPNQVPTPLAGGVGDSETTPLQIPAALSALDILNNISLLVSPETVSISDLGIQRDVVLETISYVEDRPHLDLFYIVDPPCGLSVTDVVAFKTGAASDAVPTGNALHSSYGAIYYPWVDILDPTSNKIIPVPPSGIMAGTYASADNQVGPWQVAAGITYGALGIATGLEYYVTDADQDVLNPQGVNAIRSLVNYGIVAYGGRTLSTDPSLIYISVRRLLIEVEVSLYWGLQWVVFEPNTPRLQGTVTRDVTEFLTEMWAAGALGGTTAQQAFQVQCDASNNPPETQMAGQLIIDIKIRPVYPAEFVIIRIQQATLGSGS